MGEFAPRHYDLRDGQGVVVRSAHASDAARVLLAARDVFTTSPHVLTQPDEFTLDEAGEREFIVKSLAAPDSLFVIALPDDSPNAAVLGIANLKRPLPKRKLRHTVELGMSVHSAHRGKGVGTALMDACVRWACGQPELELMTLAVYQANAAGRALYTRFGFIEYARLPGGLKHDDGTTWDQIFMYLALRERAPAAG